MKWPLLAVLCLQTAVLPAQQRPLITERAQTLSRGQALFDLGIAYLQNVIFPFSGLEGDLVRAGVLGFRVGAAQNVEIQVLGTIQNSLNVENRFDAPNTPNLNFSGSSTSDVGDFALATKIRFLPESKDRPALAFRFGVELPNASNQNGLGNDETNAFASFLLEKQVGRLRLLTNAGIAILGDPVVAGSQDDLFTYGLAALYAVHPRLHLVGDFYGRLGPGGIGTEDQSQLRLGAQIEAAGLYWDLSLLLGFQDQDPESGVILGISKEFTLFGP